MSKIQIHHLIANYAGTYSLTADCQITSGKIWQIVGANASGKTTLLSQLLYGQVGKYSSLIIDDTPVSRVSVGALEYRALFHKWTVAQNLSYFLPRNPGRCQRVYADALVDKSWYPRRAYELSNAQKKKLLIAILLEQKQKVLLLDELDDAFDSANLSRVLSTLSSWIDDDKERFVLVTCKSPIAAISSVLTIVPDGQDENHYKIKVTNDFISK